MSLIIPKMFPTISNIHNIIINTEAHAIIIKSKLITKSTISPKTNIKHPITFIIQ